MKVMRSAVKLYNPFKWHLIEYNGCYYVRRRSYFILWWNYADRDFPTSFTWPDMRSDTRLHGMEFALEILKIKRNPPKVQVIHGIPD